MPGTERHCSPRGYENLTRRNSGFSRIVTHRSIHFSARPLSPRVLAVPAFLRVCRTLRPSQPPTTDTSRRYFDVGVTRARSGERNCDSERLSRGNPFSWSPSAGMFSSRYDLNDTPRAIVIALIIDTDNIGSVAHTGRIAQLVMHRILWDLEHCFRG